jgi:hypothetical protein
MTSRRSLAEARYRRQVFSHALVDAEESADPETGEEERHQRDDVSAP